MPSQRHLTVPIMTHMKSTICVSRAAAMLSALVTPAAQQPAIVEQCEGTHALCSCLQATKQAKALLHAGSFW